MAATTANIDGGRRRLRVCVCLCVCIHRANIHSRREGLKEGEGNRGGGQEIQFESRPPSSGSPRDIRVAWGGEQDVDAAGRILRHLLSLSLSLSVLYLNSTGRRGCKLWMRRNLSKTHNIITSSLLCRNAFDGGPELWRRGGREGKDLLKFVCCRHPTGEREKSWQEGVNPPLSDSGERGGTTTTRSRGYENWKTKRKEERGVNGERERTGKSQNRPIEG